MENFWWIVSGVLLLMCLTSLKAIWRLQAKVGDLEKEVLGLKAGVKTPL